MEFALSEEQQMLQETIRQLLENECPPTHLREVFEEPNRRLYELLGEDYGW